MENPDEDRQTMDSPNNTRRQFVAGTAGAFGGLAAGAGIVGPALGNEHDEEEDDEDDDDEDAEPGMIENEFEDDVEILNFARTLEFLEADFYRQGLENISEEEFCNCEVLQEDSPLTDRVYEELETIQEHEETHAQVLGDTVQELGGEPVDEPEFDFGLRVEFPGPFLATAALLEDIGVSAYAGAAPFIENEDLVAPALSIHSVEARHASFLRTLRNETGFPDAFDAARSRSEVLELAAPFIVDDEVMDEEVPEGEELPEDDEEDDDSELPGDDEDDDNGMGNGEDDDDGVGNGDDDDNGVGNGDDDDDADGAGAAGDDDDNGDDY